MKKLLLSVVSLLVIGLSALFLYPSPVDSVSWTPPPAPDLDAIAPPNELLTQAELLAKGEIYGPEDVAVDKQGRVYGATQDGLIKRVLPNGTVETWVETFGRPLGLHFDANDNLIVCDAYKGLLSISPDANITVLTTEADGTPFVFTDDLDIASDGKIYFTDASSKWNQANFMLDLMETRPYGRFLVYDPATKQTTTLISDMYFSNGVALSQNEDFVLVNETWRYRIIRYWLTGEKAGTHEIFVDNLPGFPDGISSNRKGRFWLALPTLRLPTVDKMHPKAWLKNLSAKLPESLKPKPIDYGLVLGLDEQGNIVTSLHDPSGAHLKEITSVEEHNDHLYFGSLHNDRIGRLALKNL
ncbi:gluconolactonase [Gammaproteobacteria bacterium 45_16_T64]|nr:gluconolactonase [Gammaproteobacteria bacterium 45_16_T64]